MQARMSNREVMVQFAGKPTPLSELVARCLAANYLVFGFADDGEADKVADRLLAVFDSLQIEVRQKLKAER